MLEPTTPMDRIAGDLAEVTRRQSRVVEELIASRDAIRMARYLAGPGRRRAA